MAPKRRKVVGSVVRTKTTRKVVKETVEVSLVETDNNSEPQLTQEEENRDTEEREEGRVEIDLSGKTPTRVIAVQDPEAKLKAEEQPPEKEPEYATPPEDVVEDPFPLLDEDHEDGEKETEKGEHEGREGKPAAEDQVQPEEQDEEEETQDIAQKEVEAAMDETGETPPEEEQEKQQEQKQEQEQVKQGEAAPASGKRETESKKRGRKKRRVKRMEMGEREGYKRYIHRVLKQVHPELGISSNAITVLDGFMKDMFERLAGEANNLTKYTKKMTLSSREVQAAVRLVLPGELGKHAVVEGNKAVANYMSYDEGVAAGTTKKKKA